MSTVVLGGAIFLVETWEIIMCLVLSSLSSKSKCSKFSDFGLMVILHWNQLMDSPHFHSYNPVALLHSLSLSPLSLQGEALKKLYAPLTGKMVSVSVKPGDKVEQRCCIRIPCFALCSADLQRSNVKGLKIAIITLLVKKSDAKYLSFLSFHTPE